MTSGLICPDFIPPQQEEEVSRFLTDEASPQVTYDIHFVVNTWTAALSVRCLIFDALKTTGMRPTRTLLPETLERMRRHKDACDCCRHKTMPSAI